MCREFMAKMYGKYSMVRFQGPYCTGNTGKMAEIILVMENTGNLKFCQNAGNFICSIYLIKFPDSKDIALFAAKFSRFILGT